MIISTDTEKHLGSSNTIMMKNFQTNGKEVPQINKGHQQTTYDQPHG